MLEEKSPSPRWGHFHSINSRSLEEPVYMSLPMAESNSQTNFYGSSFPPSPPPPQRRTYLSIEEPNLSSHTPERKQKWKTMVSCVQQEAFPALLLVFQKWSAPERPPLPSGLPAAPLCQHQLCEAGSGPAAAAELFRVHPVETAHPQVEPLSRLQRSIFHLHCDHRSHLRSPAWFYPGLWQLRGPH